MEVQVEKTGACSARISLTVPADEFEAEVQRGLTRVGKHVRMKGFRPGKVPAAVVARAHGGQVRLETTQQFLSRAYEQAVQENELRPASHPHIHVEELVPDQGQDLVSAFDLNLRPDIELGDYRGLEVQGRPVDVTDEEVEAALADVRRQNSHPEPAGDDGLADDGMAIAKVELLHGDEVLHTREGMRLGLETPVPGSDPEAWRAAMQGGTAGREIAVEVTFPEDFEPESARGQTGAARITLDQVFRIVPPTDEELRGLFEAADDDELRSKVRDRIGEIKEEQEQARIEAALLSQVLDAHPMELPEAMVASQVDARLGRLRAQLEQAGATGEDLEARIEGERQGAREAAERSMRALFLIEAIGQKEGLQVSEEDMVAEIHAIAQRNQASFEEVREYYAKEQGLLNQLGVELQERKVRRFLREAAEILPPAGS